MKLVKKLTVKNVLGRKTSAALLGDKDEVMLMTVYGKAASVLHGQHDFGDGNISEFDKFKGDFEAVKTDDGTVVRSGVMILPEVAGDLLANVVNSLDEGAGAVEFAFSISIRKADTTIGYEYVADPLTESREHDPLATMRAQLTGKPGMPALEDKTGKVADIKDAKPEPTEPEPAKAPAKKAAAKK